MFKEFRTFRSKHFTPWYRKGKRAWPNFTGWPDPAEPGADIELTELTRKIGDAAAAKRVRGLQVQFPNGTVPELVTMDWLNAGKYRYIYQGQLYGGRSRAGGLLPDFVVQTGGGYGMAWQIQGDYWHDKRSVEKQFKDNADNLRLLGQNVGGIKISKVIPVFESDIYNRRNTVFTLALAGVSLR
jgi:hypothetical protein